MPVPFKRNPRVLAMVVFGLIWAILVSVPFVQTAVKFQYFKLTRFEFEWFLLFAPGFIPALIVGYLLGPIFAKSFFLRSIRWQLLAVALWSILAPIYVFLLLFRVQVSEFLNHELSLSHMFGLFLNGYPAFALLSSIITLPVTLIASGITVILIKRLASNSIILVPNP